MQVRFGIKILRLFLMCVSFIVFYIGGYFLVNKDVWACNMCRSNCEGSNNVNYDPWTAYCFNNHVAYCNGVSNNCIGVINNCGDTTTMCSTQGSLADPTCCGREATCAGGYCSENEWTEVTDVEWCIPDTPGSVSLNEPRYGQPFESKPTTLSWSTPNWGKTCPNSQRSYIVQVAIAGTSNWFVPGDGCTNPTSNSCNATGLQICTTYQLRVAANNGGKIGQWSTIGTFQTPCYTRLSSFQISSNGTTGWSDGCNGRSQSACEATGSVCKWNATRNKCQLYLRKINTIASTFGGAVESSAPIVYFRAVIEDIGTKWGNTTTYGNNYILGNWLWFTDQNNTSLSYSPSSLNFVYSMFKDFSNYGSSGTFVLRGLGSSNDVAKDPCSCTWTELMNKNCDAARPGSSCSGLSQSQCNTNTACVWNAVYNFCQPSSTSTTAGNVGCDANKRNNPWDIPLGFGANNYWNNGLVNNSSHYCSGPTPSFSNTNCTGGYIDTNAVSVTDSGNGSKAFVSSARVVNGTTVSSKLYLFNHSTNIFDIRQFKIDYNRNEYGSWQLVASNKVLGDEYQICKRLNVYNPVYRIWMTNSNVLYNDHLYTTNKNERDILLNKSGNYDEGIGFFVYSNQISGTIPLYRKISVVGGTDHFYTINVNEGSTSGYNVESVLGYVYAGSSSCPAETQPLYRFFSSSWHDHVYNLDCGPSTSCYNTWLGYGYAYEGIAACVPAQSSKVNDCINNNDREFELYIDNSPPIGSLTVNGAQNNLLSLTLSTFQDVAVGDDGGGLAAVPILRIEYASTSNTSVWYPTTISSNSCSSVTTGTMGPITCNLGISFNPGVGTYTFRAVVVDLAGNIGYINSGNSYSVNNPWFITRNGDLYSGGGINNSIPSGNLGNVGLSGNLSIMNTYFVYAYSTMNAGAGSLVNTVATNGMVGWTKKLYRDNTIYNLGSGVTLYSYLHNIASARSPIRSTGLNLSDSNNGIYEVNDFTVNSGTVCNGSKVVFVNGNLVLNPPITSGVDGGCLFVVSGNATINVGGDSLTDYNTDSVTDDLVQVGIIADGYISIPNDTVALDQLYFKGILFAIGTNPTLTNSPSIIIGRSLGVSNSSRPSAIFEYDPRYIVILKNLLGRVKVENFNCGTVTGRSECAIE